MSEARAVGAELIAVLVAVTAGVPRVLTIEDGRALPSGPVALEHRSLQAGLWPRVEAQPRHLLGDVEQPYTFGNRDRGFAGERRIAIRHLGLTRPGGAGGGWRDGYGRFPHEGRRAGPPPAIAEVIAPALRAWTDAAP